MDQPDDGRTDGAGIRSERWLWRIASRLQSEVHVRGGVHSFSKLSVLRGRTEFCAGRQQGGSEVQEMGCTGGTGGRRTVPRISLKIWEKIEESAVRAGISASVWYLRLARPGLFMPSARDKSIQEVGECPIDLV